MIREAIKKTKAVVSGNIVKIQNYGNEAEPQKDIWNGCIGEIREIKKDFFRVRVTDVRGSKVLYSRKWANREKDALNQILHLKRSDFVLLSEVEELENIKKPKRR